MSDAASYPIWSLPWVAIREGAERVVGAFQYVFLVAQLIYRAAASAVWEGRRGRRLTWRVFFQQIYFTAGQAFWLLVFVALAAGGLLMHQASIILPRYGFPDYAESLTVLVLFKEIGPVMVALVVIARSANAIVIEIGNMQVNGELRALDALGINLDRFVILPRILGMTLSVVILTGWFSFAALYGGFSLAEFSGLLESNFLLEDLEKNFTTRIVLNIALRAFLFGLIIGSVACLHGLRVEVSPTEVPQQASRGVVRSLSLCFVANFAVSIYV